MFFGGMFFGLMIRYHHQDEMNRAQQERGDYWFDRCQSLIERLEEHGEDWKK